MGTSMLFPILMIVYDDYGRETGRVDDTNHGYGDVNNPNYHTVPHWYERMYNAQNRDGKKINYRTDRTRRWEISDERGNV